MSDSASAATSDAAMRDGIPLDLTPLLAPYRQHRRLSLRVVHLPARAQLSTGVRNEDASWSLAPADLDGLALLLPDDTEPPPSIAVRIVVIDKNENASVVGQFEVPLPHSTRLAKPKGDTESALAEAEARWRAESEARLAEQTRQLEAEWQQRIQDERSARDAADAKAEEAVRKATALSGELEAALARAAAAEAGKASDSERIAEVIETRLAEELEARIAAARSEWNRESDVRIAAAVTQAVRISESAAETRLEEARAEWRKDAEQNLDAAGQRCTEAESAVQRLEAALAESEVQWKENAATQLSEQAARLQQEWQTKLLAERNAREDAESRAEAAAQKASALSGELEAALAQRATARDDEKPQQAEDGEARLAKELDEVKARLAVARSEWSKESQARVAAAAEQAARKAEAAAEARLRQARGDWEKETRAALAIAEGQLRAEAGRRLAEAQAEWNRNAPAQVTAGRRKLRGVARRQGRTQAWRRIRQACVIAGCLAAVLFLYTEYKPVLAQWTPKIQALAGNLGAAALSEVQALTQDLTGGL
ncbi:MAG: hypothetical protein ACFCUT_02925 [Kiloniellaceae bacterium]